MALYFGSDPEDFQAMQQAVVTVRRDGQEIYRGSDPEEIAAAMQPGDVLTRGNEQVIFQGYAAPKAKAKAKAKDYSLFQHRAKYL